MSILSAILYFITQHSVLGIFLFPLVGLVFAMVMSEASGHKLWYSVIVVFFLLGIFNVFGGHMLNAAFINAFGTVGSAVIVHSEETNSTLNDQYIWAYDAVLKTVDGQDVETSFDTMSASIYPIRNAILIPPEGETFVAKYIPGFERNIAIMSDLSDYGKRRLINEDTQPVSKAAAKYAVSPANQTFIEEYRVALRSFIAQHAGDAEPELIDEYKRRLAKLDRAGNK
jgi:hypothetical protein